MSPLPRRIASVVTALALVGAPVALLGATADALPVITCQLAVPANPTTAAGLATPWQLSGAGCAEANPNFSAFVQAAIISPTPVLAAVTARSASLAAAATVPKACKVKKYRDHHKKKCAVTTQPVLPPPVTVSPPPVKPPPVTPPPVTLPPVVPPSGADDHVTISIYSPLVTTAGMGAAIAPVVPVIPAGSSVAVWVGFNGADVHLVGPGAVQMVNGTSGSDFGQFAYSSSAPAFFATAYADAATGGLTVPPLGHELNGTACPSITSFAIVDQDPSDNVQTKYLTNGETTAQDTAFNRFSLPGNTVVSNPSDNALLSVFVDPAIGCQAWLAPNLADPGSTVPGLALDQIQAHFFQAAPVANVELADEMTLSGGNLESILKTDLYRMGVGEPMVPLTDLANGDETWCSNLAATGPAFLAGNQAVLMGTPSPIPAMANNLFTFLAARFVGTYEQVLPTPGVLQTCDMLTGIADPVTVTFTGGVATAATINLVGD